MTTDPADGPGMPLGPGTPSEGSFRVEELAIRTALPVRTIREYQTWRLLHPPERRGRVGWYDESHVDRLRTIARLQQRGYSIAAIRDLLEAWTAGSGLRDVLGVDGAAQPDGLDEAPMILAPDAISELAPVGHDAEAFTAALLASGVVRQVGSDFVARSPALLVLVGDMMQAGVAPDEALRAARAVITATAAVADDIADVAATAVDGIDPLLLDPMFRRARALLGRAVASHLMDQLGRSLAERAATQPALGEVVDRLRIGSFDVARTRATS